MWFYKLFHTIFLANATYNSLRQQVGFCKMQGYDTISRSTSVGPSLFTSGDVQFGIGLSDNQFDGRLCGMCIEILSGENIRTPLNSSLDVFTNTSITKFPIIAMVFDQCTDPICVKPKSFIDFDVYSETPPVWRGNPHDLKWRAIECPVSYGHHGNYKHFIEYLICTPSTCNVNDNSFANASALRDIWNPNYFSLTIRNTRIPIIGVQLNDESLDYVNAFGWTFSGEYIKDREFVIELEAYDGTRLLDIFSFDQVMNLKPLPNYRGGALLQSNHQI